MNSRYFLIIFLFPVVMLLAMISVRYEDQTGSSRGIASFYGDEKEPMPDEFAKNCPPEVQETEVDCHRKPVDH